MTEETLLVMALKSESRGLFSHLELLHTGVGKVNAALSLAARLSQGKTPSLVLNLGSAGSAAFAAGSVVNPTRFIQRDMDVQPLGFALWQTPYEDEIELVGIRLDAFPEAICGTGDNFDMSGAKVRYDVVDMEAYALAKVCRHFNAPFASLKFISDGADGAAATDWATALDACAASLRLALDSLPKF